MDILIIAAVVILMALLLIITERQGYDRGYEDGYSHGYIDGKEGLRYDGTAEERNPRTDRRTPQ